MTDLALYLVPDEPRPRTRGDCVGGPRPCPYAGCRHHLLISSISAKGELRGPDQVEIEDMTESCSLDVADREEHGAPLREIAGIMGLSLERVRQIEEDGLARLAKRVPRDLLEGWAHTSAAAHEEPIGDLVDAEFKAAVGRAYERIVPEGERGAKAIRVARRGGP